MAVLQLIKFFLFSLKSAPECNREVKKCGKECGANSDSMRQEYLRNILVGIKKAAEVSGLIKRIQLSCVKGYAISFSSSFSGSFSCSLALDLPDCLA